MTVRDVILFVGGMILCLCNVLILTEPNVGLLAVGVAMIGVPAVFSTVDDGVDRQRRYTFTNPVDPYPLQIPQIVISNPLVELEKRIEQKKWEYARRTDLIIDWDALAKEIEPDLRKLVEAGR